MRSISKPFLGAEHGPAPLTRTRLPGRVFPGDQEQAFGLIYNRYYPLLTKYIHAVCRSHTTCAEDIAQDIFFKLWQRRDRMTEIASWGSYLMGIVKNRLIDEKRKTAVRRAALQHFTGTASRLYYGPEEDLNYRETRRLLCQAIRSLPPRARMAYLLKEQAGLKNEDIARRMGVSKSVVKQHIQLAKNKIRPGLTCSWSSER